MRVAVVGSGVSGLAATWLLNEYSDHEVYLFEADARPGGHANTITFTPSGKNDPVYVDTGFIVFNPCTYPNFINFLNLYPNLKSRILKTEMTFSVSRDAGLFEWAGKNLFSVFCQPSRLLDISMWRLLYDVFKFNACSRRVVLDPKEGEEEMSIGEYIEREGYSDSFRDNYLIPMTAAIWSTPPDKCALDFPARTLIQFMSNHHLLQVTGKPSWLTLRGGSRSYVSHIIANLPSSRLHLNTPVLSLRRSPNPSTSGESTIELCTANNETHTFDHVIMACHSDTTLEILRRGGGATGDEERILGSFKWNRNEAILHTDTSLMPKRRLAWTCWNYLTTSEVGAKGQRKANVNQVALTYNMNELQHISEARHGSIFVTLNPPYAPAEDKTFGKFKYDHPIFDTESIHAQREMHKIQNTRGVSYAGAWLSYGFHEDGFTSGLRAALSLGDSIHPPYEIRSADRVPPRHDWAAKFFDVLEGSGLNSVLGWLFVWFIHFWKFWFGMVFDLDHLDADWGGGEGLAFNIDKAGRGKRTKET